MLCGTKSANSGFVNPGLREKCLCRPCYAPQLRASLRTFGVGVHVETHTELDTVISEGGMYVEICLFVFVFFISILNEPLGLLIFSHFFLTETSSQSSQSTYHTVSG